MGSLYQPAPQEQRNWRPFVIGLLIIVVAIVAIWAVYRNGNKVPQEARIDPYAANLQFSDLHLSKAENFVGGEVTYVGGKISNTGSQTVVQTQVEILFRNSMGEVVQKETQALRVAQTELGNRDYVTLSPTAPLTPNQTRDFRFVFEHVSADWNQGYPELRVTSTKLQ
jgi:uncharacterized protein YpmB